MKATAGLDATSTEVAGAGCRCHVRPWDEIRRPFTSWFLLCLLLSLSCLSGPMRPRHRFSDRKARWPHPQTFHLKSTREASLEISQVPQRQSHTQGLGSR